MSIVIDPADLPVPPVIYAEIVLCFDYDFPVSVLNGILGIQATGLKRQCETRINPITHLPNPGYWEYRTKEFSSFDCDPLFALLQDLLSELTSNLEQVFVQYLPSDFFVRIYVEVQQENEFPAIRVTPQLLSTMTALNASLDIIVEGDYETAGESLEFT